MGFYMIVEGKTEKKVYSKWLKILLPHYKEVKCPYKIENNGFYILNAEGYPKILKVAKDSLSDICDNLQISKLFICLDSDDEKMEKRKDEIKRLVKNYKIDTRIIVQNICIESWLLGNKKLMSKSPDKPLSILKTYYDVSKDDPELMQKPKNHPLTTAGYHESYLTTMLKEKHLNYSKRSPECCCKKSYLDNLIKRYVETKHISSFGVFMDEIKKF
ncbi:hypothetical protein [Fusobacterium sp. PH5-44]|uniref:hypothetical protein n=1 Tax=unclassified Fusobacterium TaxID=2648384 RepID=UPI003D213804